MGGSDEQRACSIDDSKPLLQQVSWAVSDPMQLVLHSHRNTSPRPACVCPHPQLAHLDAAQYQDWLRRPSRGRARFFASDALEAVTHVQW